MRARFHTIAVVLGIAGIVVLVGVGAYAIGSSFSHAKVVTIRAAIYGECHRINVGRITGNRNNYADYKLDTAEIALLQSGTTPAAPIVQALLDTMVQTTHTKSWTPLSNCVQATDHPLSYVPPAAVPFYARTPPLSAFTLGPNQ